VPTRPWTVMGCVTIARPGGSGGGSGTPDPPAPRTAGPGPVGRAPPDRNVVAKRTAVRGRATRTDKTDTRCAAAIHRAAGVMAARCVSTGPNHNMFFVKWKRAPWDAFQCGAIECLLTARPQILNGTIIFTCSGKAIPIEWVCQKN